MEAFTTAFETSVEALGTYLSGLTRNELSANTLQILSHAASSSDAERQQAVFEHVLTHGSGWAVHDALYEAAAAPLEPLLSVLGAKISRARLDVAIEKAILTGHVAAVGRLLEINKEARLEANDFAVIRFLVDGREFNVSLVEKILEVFPNLKENDDEFSKTPLYCAIKANAVDFVKKLIAEVTDTKSYTSGLILATACKYASYELFLIVYEKFGEDQLDFVDPKSANDTLLHYAARNKNYDADRIIEHLAEAKPALLTNVNTDMETPVFCAASCSNQTQVACCRYMMSRMTKEEINELSTKEVFEEVINNIYNEEIVPFFLKWDPRYVDYKNSSGENLLCIVLMESRGSEPSCLAALDYLLANHPTLIDGISHEGKHCFHHVRFPSAIDRLAKIKPELLAQVDNERNSVLHAACDKSDVRLVRKFLEYEQVKEIILTQNESGDSVAFSCYSDVEILDLLVDTNPGLLDLTNQQGENLLHRISGSQLKPGMSELFHKMLALRPQMLTQRDNEGNTPLTNSVGYYSDGIARQLVEMATPEDLLMGNNEGETIIKNAIYYGKIKLIEILLEKQPELIHSTSRNGDNLLHELMQLRNDNFRKILDLFIKMKPTLITGVNNDGDTPLHKVNEPQYCDFIEYALKRYPALVNMKNFKQQSIAVPHTSHQEAILDTMLRLHPELISMTDEKGCNILHALLDDYRPKYSIFQLIMKYAEQQKYDLFNAKSTEGMTPLMEYNFDAIGRGYDRYFNAFLMFQTIFEKTTFENEDALFAEIGERWSKTSFMKRFISSNGKHPERVLDLILQRFPNAITENSIEPAFEEGAFYFLLAISKRYPLLTKSFTRRLAAKITEGSIYASQELADFVVTIFPPKTLFHVMLSSTTNSAERFHTHFLDFFCLKFSNSRSPTIELKQFSLLKTYQALKATGMGRHIINTHFKKRGFPQLDQTITYFINKHFFRFYLVAKEVQGDSVFCNLLAAAFGDIFSKLVAFLGPLSLWNVAEEPLPSLFAVDVVPDTTSHHHPLAEEDNYDPQPFMCDGKCDAIRPTCDTTNGRRFKCYECNYNLCPECYDKVKTAQDGNENENGSDDEAVKSEKSGDKEDSVDPDLAALLATIGDAGDADNTTEASTTNADELVAMALMADDLDGLADD